MAIKTPCLTSGAQFHITVYDDGVAVEVAFPGYLDLSEEEAEILEARLHNAVECVLASYWPRLSRPDSSK